MSRLISVDELKEWIKNWLDVDRNYHPYSKQNNIPIPELYDILERMPTIERKTGRWIETTERLGHEDLACCACSACGHPFILGDWTIDEVKEEMSYCYRCGARMDESSPMERINAPIMPTRRG